MASSKPSADSTQLAKGPLSVAAKLREQGKHLLLLGNILEFIFSFSPVIS